MPNRKKPMLEIATYFALFTLMQFVTTFVTVTVVLMKFMAENPGGDSQAFILEFATNNAVNMVLLSTLCTIAVLFIMSLVKKTKFLEFIGAQKKTSFYIGIMCLLAGLAANIWVAIIMEWLPIPAEIMNNYQEASAPIASNASIFAVITVVLLAPILEEIIFRGLILSRLRMVVGAGTAILFQGLLFGVMHGSIVWAVYAGVLGAILGYITLCTGTIRSAILFHIAFNGGNIVLNLILSQVGQSHDVLLILLGVSSVVLLFCMQKISAYNPL